VRIDARGPIHKFVSGPKLSPLGMMRQILKLTRNLSFDAVSIGYRDSYSTAGSPRSPTTSARAGSDLTSRRLSASRSR